MSNLQGRALDAAVAERVMGWKLEGHFWQQPDGCELFRHQWEPSIDPRDVITVRAEIERRGLTESYIEELWDLLTVEPSLYCAPSDYWAILNATPEQQCRAALKALEGANA